MFLYEETDIDDIRSVYADDVLIIRESEKVKEVRKDFLEQSVYNRGKVLSLLSLDPDDFDSQIISGKVKILPEIPEVA